MPYNDSNNQTADETFQLKLPEDLQVKLLAIKREHFLGSVPAFVIPAMLVLVWSVIIVVLVLVPWR